MAITRTASIEDSPGYRLEGEGAAARSGEEAQSVYALESLFDGVTDAVITFSESGIIESANTAACLLFGYTAHELTSMDLGAILRVGEDEPWRPLADSNRSLESRQSFRPLEDVLGYRKDGAKILLDITLSRLKQTNGNRYLAVLRNITKSKEAPREEKARGRIAALAAEVGVALTHGNSLEVTLQSCVQAIVKHLDAAFARIWTINVAGDTLDLQASAGIYTHLNGPHGHVPVGQFKIGRIAQNRAAHLTNSVLTDPQVGDKEWARKEGMVAFAGHPLIVDGRLVGVMAMFARDALSDDVLTSLSGIADGIALGIERFWTSDDLRRAMDAAEAAVIAKGQFLGAMSHEIRTPLNAIIGSADILAKSPLSVEQGQLLRIIRDSGEALLTIINDILDYSRIEAGGIELESDSFNLRSLVEDTIALIQNPAEARQLKVSLLFERDVPAGIKGDATRLRQILLNLLSNAVKFTEAGQIDIVITREQNCPEGLCLRFVVADTGIGISQEIQPHLFRSFSQADGSMTRKYGGTGLGLAISKRLVNLMGGEIGVESNVGQGSTFWFTIKAEETDQIVRPAGAPAYCKLNLKVLVAEDNRINQTVIRTMLQKAGCRVDIAESGRRAVELSQLNDYDVILMDCQMSDMDGYQATEAIRKLEGTNGHTAIVALTANAFAEDRRRCFEAGMDDFLSKPVAMSKLLDTIDKWGKRPIQFLVN